MSFFIYEIVNSTYDQFAYLTYWGFAMTALTYTFLMIQYAIKLVRQEKASFKSTNTGFEEVVEETAGTKFLWQFNAWAFGTILTVNTVITIVYWLFLSSGESAFLSVVFHSTPLIATFVDFVLNNIVIELNLTIWTTILTAVYLLVNFLYY